MSELVGWLVGWLDFRHEDKQERLKVGCLVGWLVGWLDFRHADKQERLKVGFDDRTRASYPCLVLVLRTRASYPCLIPVPRTRASYPCCLVPVPPTRALACGIIVILYEPSSGVLLWLIRCQSPCVLGIVLRSARNAILIVCAWLGRNVFFLGPHVL